MYGNFMLNNQTAIKLYSFVKELPIIDYHNHLSLNDLYKNTRFTDIFDLWLGPDPYKHRAMRMCGVDEKYITGNADKKEKFIKWCETCERLIGNPLYHWTYMELKLFGIDQMPNSKNAEEIYNKCNAFLQENQITPNYFLNKFNTELICPCCGLSDDLNVLSGLNGVAPSLRADNLVAPQKNTIKALSEKIGFNIISLSDYEKAISMLIKKFKEAGCVFCDHALDSGFIFYSDDGLNQERFLNAENLCGEDKEKLFSYLLVFLAKEYSKNGMVMQLHVGAQRYTSSKLRESAGAQGGFAAIGSCIDVRSLCLFLDTVDKSKYGLPKTVLFTLNPADNAVFSTLSGSFSKNGVGGLITQGPAWWWCDHKKGMEDMLNDTAVFSLLYNFVGMTTDSRSFLSFVRHDYFRRILCSLLGRKYENGEIFSFADLETLVNRICYYNVKELIGGINNAV